MTPRLKRLRSAFSGQIGEKPTPESSRESRDLRKALIELRDQRLLQAFLEGKNDISDELVFPSPEGSILDPTTSTTVTRAGPEQGRHPQDQAARPEAFVRLIADSERCSCRLPEGTNGTQLHPSDTRYLRAPNPRGERLVCEHFGSKAQAGCRKKSATPAQLSGKVTFPWNLLI